MLFSEDEHSEESKNLDNQVQIIRESWSSLETFISTTSSRFIRSINFDDAINITLRDMGILSEASTAFIFLFNEALMHKTHEWCDEDVSSQIRRFQNLKKQEFPWWMEQLTSGKLINIKNIVDLPNEAKNLRELLEILNIKSMLNCPLSIDGNLAGLIGFSSISRLKKWTNLDLSLLRVSSQIISTAIQRSRMEEVIKKSEEKYRFITENMNDLIAIINSRLNFEYLNDKTAFTLLGYQYKEIVNQSCLDFIHTEDVDKVINNFSHEFDAGEFKIELRLRHKNGNWIWFESRVQSFTDNNQSKKWLVISRDISERKSAEERYKSLFDNSPNAIILINFNGIIVDSNSTTTRLFNYQKEDLINKSINELDEIFQLDIKQYFKEIFQASFKKNFPDPIEVKVKKKKMISFGSKFKLH